MTTTMQTAASARAAALLGTALMLALPGASLAQEAPGREQLEAQQGQPAPTPPSRLSVEGGFERGDCALADPAMASVKVTFSRVSFAGLPGIPAGELDEAWQDLAGKEQPLAALCEVRDRAATILRARGFLAAVQVPPQRIEKDGEVQMDVLAAKLVDVEVRGNPGHAEAQIAAHLRKLTDRPWFNIREAERQLLLLRDLPGFDVRLKLRPAGTAPGAVIGEVTVRRRAIELLVGGQNLGAKATGREGAVAQLTVNDLTGLGDRTVASLFSTLQPREQTVASLSHDFAVGAEGLRIGGRLVYARARPDIAGGAFSSRTWIGSAELSYPLVRRQGTRMVGSAGLDHVDQVIDFGAVRLSTDKLRVGWGKLGFDMVDGASLAGRGGHSLADPFLRLGGEVELRKGLAAFGASRPCDLLSNCLSPNVPLSNFAANPQGGLIRAEARLELRPFRGVTVLLSPRGQYSASRLLSFEQFTLGNYTIGRGFDPGAVQGDSGLGLGAELRAGRLLPDGPDGFAIQPYTFVDAGWAWTNDGGITPMRRLVSTGGGARLRWGDHADVNLLVAVPLERVPGATQLGAARVLMTFSTRLLPWKSQ
ncbi:ShlB/FhaC/HecB family hemolysin secretion/activation protein [Novosphingobium flavum]|uniref:ShlB/FhaC/HecB family hemolysin secretion/activation protein n=1 Tax=Novosphingobium flavum TaxID=1778672 RepID=A0A7X1KK23_9SPHN|nr:ShlB/FhaC/HecB family hemolysin secretion/activation protein [Novosphingobium flavum]MBC2664076.1 ShlB/FhaC/HecB family hemolysin secretion/activation protein [Novosphingobium flavum]